MIRLDSIKKSFRDQVIFDGLSLHIKSRVRLGIIGPNGSGKTTLFNIIRGEEAVDDGKITLRKDVSIGYVAQEVETMEGKSVLEETLSIFPRISKMEHEIEIATAELSESPNDSRLLDRLSILQDEYEKNDGYSLENRGKVILSGLGFHPEKFSVHLEKLSGGWKMRVALAKVLLLSPDVLLLDEPTNHLDLESLIWLEKFLMDYEGSVLIISHDRFFLDRLVTHLAEIEFQKMAIFHGNYTAYELDKVKKHDILIQQAKTQGREIEQTKRFIERFRYKKKLASRVQSKIKELDKMKRVDVPSDTRKKMKFSFPAPSRSGLKVMELKNIHQAYGDLIVYENLNFQLERGDKIALVGPNGAGKSTLMKLLADVIPHKSGTITKGHNVDMNYYAQHQLDVLDPNSTVLKTVESISEGLTHTQLRSYLGTFLFTGENVDKKVKVLSGGEKSRLVLAKLLLKPANLMLMDEPTNHLDIPSQDVLIDAMQQYSGTMVCISHDRRFLNAVCNKVTEVIDGNVKEYHGNYDYFLWKKEEVERQLRAVEIQRNPAEISVGQISYEERKSQKRAERKRKRLIEKYENQIAQFEDKIEEIRKKMEIPEINSNPTKLQVLMKEMSELRYELNVTYDLWAESQES